MTPFEQPEGIAGSQEEELITLAEYRRRVAENGGEFPEESLESPEPGAPERQPEKNEEWALGVLGVEVPGSPFRYRGSGNAGRRRYWDFDKDDEEISAFKRAPRYRVWDNGETKKLW